MITTTTHCPGGSRAALVMIVVVVIIDGDSLCMEEREKKDMTKQHGKAREPFHSSLGHMVVGPYLSIYLSV